MRHRKKFLIAWILVGLFNNNSWVLVQVAADDLAKSFDKSQFMGLFLFFMIFFGMVSRYIHGALFVRVKHFYRIIIVTCLTLTSFTLISFACFNDDRPKMFWISVLASVLVGIS